MRAASGEFQALVDKNSTLLIKATLDLADGTTLSLDGKDFMSANFEEATSSSNSFDIGAAIIGQSSISLNNHTNKFDEYDFDGAVLRPYVGKELSDGTTEWLKMGVFTADQPDAYSGTVDLVCLDNMSKFEVAADFSSFSYPITCNAIVNHICSECDMDFPQLSLNRGDYKIASAPNITDATWLDVLGYVCQITCNWAKCDMDGRLVIDWYSTDVFTTEDWLDDKYLDDGSPYYESGDTADGGTFDDYSSGDTVFGGDFDTYRNWGTLSKVTALTINTDDVVITGIRVTAQNEVTDEGTGANGETVLQGSEGYVLDISSNPLVLYGQAAAVASRVGSACIGMTFRPFSATAFTDPTITSGDAILVLDRKNNVYRSFCTNTKLAVNAQETFECSAESASRNLARNAGASTSAYVAARKQQKRDMSTWDKALDNLGTLINNSSGLYISVLVKEDGSYVFYLHDKKELENSMIVYEISAAGSRVSTDGGKTWNAGISADGDAILKRIYAIGIDADYINTGAISIKDSSGKTIAMVGNGVESGLAVLSPYDNTTMLPLSWLAFTVPAANTDGNVAYVQSTNSTAGAATINYQVDEYTEPIEFMTCDGTNGVARMMFSVNAELNKAIGLPAVTFSTSSSTNASYYVSTIYIIKVQTRIKGTDEWATISNTNFMQGYNANWLISAGSYSEATSMGTDIVNHTFTTEYAQYEASKQVKFKPFSVYEARLSVRATVNAFYSHTGGTVTPKTSQGSAAFTSCIVNAFVATPIR